MYYSAILFTYISNLNLTQYHDCKIDMNYLNSKDKIIIFCVHTMYYLYKLNTFLEHVKKPFVLISAMEDTPFPKGFDTNFVNKIINNKYFTHWFSINKTIENNNMFTSIPYGLDFWTLTTKPYFDEHIQNFKTQNDNLTSIVKKSKHFSQRIPKIFSNFHLTITDTYNGNYRTKLQTIIPTNIIDYQHTKVSRTKTYENMIEYSFIISPFGHGYDCIRTFEALCLGCIVIMKKSFLDIIYTELPVLIVDEWEDINEQLLYDTLISYSNKKFNYDKLHMNYWINLINSKF